MTRILNFFEIEEYELLVFRIWTILMAVFIPVYGLFLIYFVDDAIEYMSHRWMFSAFWLFFLITSFFHEGMKKYLALPCFIGNFIVIAWIIWIVNENSFSPDYSTGLFLTLSGIAIINRTYIEMLSFYIFSFLLLFYAFYFYPEAQISKAVFLLSIFILFIVHIVVMRKRDYINNSLKILNEKLTTKNRRLKQLVFVSSHDLKSPLRNIGSFSSILATDLKEQDLDEKEKELYHKFILDGVVKMDTKLDDLIDYFKFDSIDIEVDNIDLNEKITSIQDKIKRIYPEENIQFKIDANLPSTIKGNDFEINALFFRLFDNSIKYNQSEIKEIALNYSSTLSDHFFTLKDNGIGIDLKNKDRIFDLFQRLHRDDEFSGTGVGLAICKAILENHKGEIWLEEGNLGQGSVFRFRIPKKM